MRTLLSPAGRFLQALLVVALLAALTPAATAIPAIVAICLACLALLGFVGARLGGASPPRSVLRTLLWGALAMAVTAGAGHLFGAAI